VKVLLQLHHLMTAEGSQTQQPLRDGLNHFVAGIKRSKLEAAGNEAVQVHPQRRCASDPAPQVGTISPPPPTVEPCSESFAVVLSAGPTGSVCNWVDVKCGDALGQFNMQL
jgi:hypothetical protein